MGLSEEKIGLLDHLSQSLGPLSWSFGSSNVYLTFYARLGHCVHCRHCHRCHLNHRHHHHHHHHHHLDLCCVGSLVRRSRVLSCSSIINPCHLAHHHHCHRYRHHHHHQQYQPLPPSSSSLHHYHHHHHHYHHHRYHFVEILFLLMT